MTVSHLDTAPSVLLARVIEGLEGQDYDFTPLSMSVEQYLAFALSDIGGSTVSHLNLSFEQLLAGLVNAYGYGPASHLTHTTDELLAILVNAIDAIEEGATIQISASTIAESASVGALVGTFSVNNGTGTYTFNLTDDAGGLFALDGDDLEVDGALDYETATSHSITVEADNGVDPVIQRTLSINVSNVLEVTLAALTLSAASIVEDSAENTVVGAIQNGSAGATIVMHMSAGGRFKIVGSNVVAGSVPTDFESASSYNITLRETHTDGSNSPRDTTLAITVTNVLEVTLSALSLSASSVAENSGSGTVVGAIQDTTAGSTVALFDDAGGRFVISGSNIVTGLVATNYESDGSHDITLRETHADGTNSPRDTILTITVTNVLETTLAPLTLSAATIAENAAEDTVVGAIQDGTAGSTITMQDSAGSRFKVSGSNVVAGPTSTNFETATSHNITLRETHPEGSNSPRDTVIAIAVTNVLEVTLAALALSASTIAENAASGTVVGAIQNASAGSTVSLFDDAGGRFVISGSNVVAGLVATNYESEGSHNITLRETHADGNNSPRDTVIAITVTNVLEVTLAALTLSDANINENSAENAVVGAIQNGTLGSTITMQDSAGDRFKVVGLNVVAGSVPTDFETGTSHDITLRETHADGNNTPRDTIITITVVDVVESEGVAVGLKTDFSDPHYEPWVFW